VPHLSPDLIASEGSDYRAEYDVDDVHRDDLTWSRGRRRPMTKTAASAAMSARVDAHARVDDHVVEEAER
jgi:hypothetical protein